MKKCLTLYYVGPILWVGRRENGADRKETQVKELLQRQALRGVNELAVLLFEAVRFEVDPSVVTRCEFALHHAIACAVALGAPEQDVVDVLTRSGVAPMRHR